MLGVICVPHADRMGCRKTIQRKEESQTWPAEKRQIWPFLRSIMLHIHTDISTQPCTCMYSVTLGSPSVSHFLYIQLPQLLWKGPLPKPEPSTIEETQGSDACWRAKQAVHIYTVEGQNHDWHVVDWLYNKDMWVITHQWKTHQEEHWNTLTDIVRTVHRCASTVHS